MTLPERNRQDLSIKGDSAVSVDCTMHKPTHFWRPLSALGRKKAGNMAAFMAQSQNQPPSQLTLRLQTKLHNPHYD